MGSHPLPRTINRRSSVVPSLIGLLVVAVCCTGCPAGLAVTYTSLTIVEKRVASAAERFPAYSEAKQLAMLEAAATRPEYSAAVTAWREKRETAVRAIEGTHASVKLARDGIADVRAGLRKASELSTWIAPTIRAAQNLFPLLAALGWTEDAQ